MDRVNFPLFEESWEAAGSSWRLRNEAIISGDAGLFGTPTTAATSTFTISASDTNACPASRAYTVVIAPSLTILKQESCAVASAAPSNHLESL